MLSVLDAVALLLSAGLAAIGIAAFTMARRIVRRRPFETDEGVRRARRVYERILEERVHDDRPWPEEHGTLEQTVLAYTRGFIPRSPPSGWSAPVAPLGGCDWTFTADGQDVLVQLDCRGVDAVCVRVTILPPEGTTEPPSDARCREVLGRLVGIRMWIELLGSGSGRLQSSRAWVGMPDEQPKGANGQLPERLPEVEGRVVSQTASELRRHLPEKLPRGWSVPVAMPSDDGWIFQAAPFVVMLGFRTVLDRTKLFVLLEPSAKRKHPVTWEEVIGVLRHLRNVRDFVPDGERKERAVPLSFTGEITRDGGLHGRSGAVPSSGMLN